MARRSLDKAVDKQIKELCAEGDDLVAKGEFEKGFYCYRDALNLVPQPAEEWEATTWILMAIGDLYFASGKKKEAAGPFEDAVRCPGGLGNPFIHLRLGECYLELGDQTRAADELTRAYMGAGRDIFQTEDPKYFQFLETRLKPPVGQDRL